jgi:hypothetical protein
VIYHLQPLNKGKKGKSCQKRSIQGVQPKLSAVISVANQQFEIVDQFGNYIIKPQNDIFLNYQK